MEKRVKLDMNKKQCPNCKCNQFFIFDSVGLIRPILYCCNCEKIIAYLNEEDTKVAMDIIDKQREELSLYKDIEHYVEQKDIHLYNKYSKDYYVLIDLLRNFCIENNIAKINKIGNIYLSR